MPSAYPGALDSLPTTSANGTTSANIHPALHNDANDAINKIEAELGIDPANGYASVAAAIAALLAPSRRVVKQASELIPRVADGPEINGAEVSTNDVGFDVLAFDPTAAEYAYVVLDWPAGCATFTVKFEWTTTASGSGSVRWEASARCYADGDAVDQSQGTAQGVTDAWQADMDWHISGATGSITPSGTVAAGAPCMLLISRQPGHADDTMSGADASLIRIIVEFSP